MKSTNLVPVRTSKFRFMTKDEEDIYFKKAIQSGGFDVDGCTGNMTGAIVPLWPESPHWKICIKAAHFAASKRYENDLEGKRLEFISLDKANGQSVSGAMYYLTFTAKDTFDGRIKSYRAKVWYKSSATFQLMSCKIFRYLSKKPKKPVTRPRKPQGSMSSKGSKTSEAKKGAVLQARAGGILAGFTALMQKIKRENRSMPHALARDAASKKWKSLSNAEKQSFISEASLKRRRSSK